MLWGIDMALYHNGYPKDPYEEEDSPRAQRLWRLFLKGIAILVFAGLVALIFLAAAIGE
jgi:hypothetical protein